LVYREIPHYLAFINQRSTIDLYIKIRGDYRLFAARGASLPDDQFQQFVKEKAKLYLMIQDSADLEESLDAHLMDILTNSEVSPKAKAGIAYSTTMKSLKEVFHGANLKNLSTLKKVSRQIIQMIISDSRVIDNIMTITSNDHYTFMHSVKVGIYGTAMTINLFQDKIKDHNIDELSMAFFIHDIGMTKVPSTILNKEEPLTGSEWETIRKHPLWGQDRLRKAHYESNETTEIILYHHERCNGNGYPFKKSGSEIPLYAKICAIADTFESLTTGRPFRPPKSPFEALRIMEAEMAREFDPELFRAFIMLLGPGRQVFPVRRSGHIMKLNR
jgi:HD-GYP domain-containing protein (c-di-GMP phosphodiesterase class II)